jgi:hypothetical protein
MSGILARIKVKHVKGAELAYFYEKELLANIGLEPTRFDANETFFNVGDVFKLGDETYKVVNIFTKFFNETYEPDSYGTNLYRIGEMLPYNFQVTYEVDNVS